MPTAARRRRVLPLADLLISLGLAGLFAAALLESTQWSTKAALFPRFVTSLGLGLTVLHLLVLGVRARRSPQPVPEPARVELPPTAPYEEADPRIVDGAAHGGGADADVEYVFAHAGRAAWARSLGWIVAFFVLFYGVGLYIAAPVFATVYLRFSARKSWLFSAAYGAVTWVVLYGALEYGLQVTTPQGVWF